MDEIVFIYLIFFITFLIPVYKFGLLSIETIALTQIYAPALGVAYMYITGGLFLNYQNMSYLQSGNDTFTYALVLYLIAFLTTVCCMCYQDEFSKKYVITKLKYLDTSLVRYIGGVIVIISLYLFHIADPGGFDNTILNTTYSNLLTTREPGNEYAYAIGQILWISSLIIILNNHTKKIFLLLFVLATIWIATWLGLHSSRMPLAAIILGISLIVIIQKKDKLLVLLLLIGSIILAIIGEIREGYRDINTVTNVGSYDISEHKTANYLSKLSLYQQEEDQCVVEGCLDYSNSYYLTKTRIIKTIDNINTKKELFSQDFQSVIMSYPFSKKLSMANRTNYLSDQRKIISSGDFQNVILPYFEADKVFNNLLDEDKYIYSPSRHYNGVFADIDINIISYKDIYKLTNSRFVEIDEIGYKYNDHLRLVSNKKEILIYDDNKLVSALPGGISNIFMSFIITVNYFENSKLFYGETFYNYLFQLAPGPVRNYFDMKTPPYYESTDVFDSYSWNGGINVISIFYANFGFLGMIIFGIFIQSYIYFLRKLLFSNNFFLIVLSIYMFSTVMQVFYYELGQIIKPMILLFALYFFSLLFVRKI